MNIVLEFLSLEELEFLELALVFEKRDRRYKWGVVRR